MSNRTKLFYVVSVSATLALVAFIALRSQGIV